MNILKFYPLVLRRKYEKYLRFYKGEVQKYVTNAFVFSLIFAVITAVLFYFLKINAIVVFFVAFILLQVFFYFKAMLIASAKIKKMETLFPDVIQLMASNLRAGMTVDKSFLLSARPEFDPLDDEILRAGREIATGKEMSYALISISKRIESEKINRTIKLIISGLKAGGNISMLLEQTANNMREKEFIERRAQSSILMYVIFIFFAAAVGAPVLFGLSTVLVQIMIDILESVPLAEISMMNIPFAFTRISVNPTFILYFAIIFLIAIDIISSLVIGLVNRGDEKYGLRYLVPLLTLSVGIFLIIRFFLYKILSQTFAAVS